MRINSAKLRAGAGQGDVKQFAEFSQKHFPNIVYTFIFPFARFQEIGPLTGRERAFYSRSAIMFLAKSVQHRFQMRLT
jgi:hypothetical protein